MEKTVPVTPYPWRMKDYIAASKNMLNSEGQIKYVFRNGSFKYILPARWMRRWQIYGRFVAVHLTDGQIMHFELESEDEAVRQCNDMMEWFTK